MFNLRTERTTDNWRARRRRLWIATMSVRLLTVTNGMMKLTSVDSVSRSMKSSKAFSRSFVISRFWSSVTGSPIDFFTFSRLTSFLKSFAEGKSPAKHTCHASSGAKYDETRKKVHESYKAKLIVHFHWAIHLFGRSERFDPQKIQCMFEMVLWNNFGMKAWSNLNFKISLKYNETGLSTCGICRCEGKSKEKEPFKVFHCWSLWLWTNWEVLLARV